MKFMRCCWILCTLLLSLAAGSPAWSAASLPVKVEILALLNHLETSGCDFNRNGSWYSGQKARQHLLRKLEYIETRGDLQSTEQFIQLAATESSFTGQTYLVRCGSNAAISSKVWLLKSLQSLRQTERQ